MDNEHAKYITLGKGERVVIGDKLCLKGIGYLDRNVTIFLAMLAVGPSVRALSIKLPDFARRTHDVMKRK